jgi:glycosyltransferase involved in cell wall biosynthesis
MESVSVVVPAHDNEATVERALASVGRAIDVLLAAHPGVACEAVVVDDASADGTRSAVERFQARDARVRLVVHPRNRGAAASRNEGARNARGSLLCFLDADDVFLERHLYVCHEVLSTLPDVQAVRTRVKLDEAIHPYWKETIENSVVFNLCVRRWCHDFVGGFLEDAAFRVYPVEDAAYRSLLDAFLNVGRVEEETVHHFRYPGNAFDRQLAKFRAPPEAAIDTLREEEKRVQPEIERAVKARAELVLRQHQSLSRKFR